MFSLFLSVCFTHNTYLLLYIVASMSSWNMVPFSHLFPEYEVSYTFHLLTALATTVPELQDYHTRQGHPEPPQLAVSAAVIWQKLIPRFSKGSTTNF